MTEIDTQLIASGTASIIPNIISEVVAPCCDHTLRILEVSKRWNDYIFLCNLDDDEFQKFCDYSFKQSYEHLKKAQGFVSCGVCGKYINSHKETYINGGQFSHRWICSSVYYDEHVPTEDNFYETKFQERLAKRNLTDTKYYVKNRDDWYTVVHKWWYADAWSNSHWDITILHWDGALALKENNEILIFFKLIRYLLSQWLWIDYIIEELSQNDWEIVLVTNRSPLKNYEIFIENAFIKPEDEYLIEYSTSTDCPYDFSLAQGTQEAFWKLLALIAVSQWQRKASMLHWLQMIKTWDFWEYFATTLL